MSFTNEQIELTQMLLDTPKVHHFEDIDVFRVEKKAAGRELNGIEHDGVPS
jgi:hypothetical protein